MARATHGYEVLCSVVRLLVIDMVHQEVLCARTSDALALVPRQDKIAHCVEPEAVALAVFVVRVALAQHPNAVCSTGTLLRAVLARSRERLERCRADRTFHLRQLHTRSRATLVAAVLRVPAVSLRHHRLLADRAQLGVLHSVMRLGALDRTIVRHMTFVQTLFVAE